jgi:hypothetical protein
MENEVFIVPNGFRKLEIFGADKERVEKAEQRINNMVQRWQGIGGPLPVNMILDESEGIDVKIEAGDEWWPFPTDRWLVPRLITSPMMNLPGDFRNDGLDGLHPTQLSTIQHAIQRALRRIRIEKAHYNFCVRFGCLTLLRSKRMTAAEVGKTYSKNTFLSSINSNVECEITRWYV